MSSLEEYLDKFCEKHRCTKKEALEHLVVQEYIKDLHERGYFEMKEAKSEEMS